MLAATCAWPSTAKLAIALARDDAEVVAIASFNHPLGLTDAVSRLFRYSAAAPVRSLAAAISRSTPDLIIPCDERAVGHLHKLQRTTRDAGVKALIERSLGAPEGYPSTLGRGPLMALCERFHLRTPPSRLIKDVADLKAWAEQQPFPWVLKADGSWGGLGVRVVHSLQEATTALRELSQPVGLRFALRQVVERQDWFWLAARLAWSRPEIIAQAHVKGRPATCALAAWRGEVIGAIQARAHDQATGTGPSSVVELVNDRGMAEAVRRIVAALELSGLFGFDFIIESETRTPYLIEMNPRSTPLCHLQLGVGRDLVGVLLARLRGAPAPIRPPVTASKTIALFPDALQREPDHPLLKSAYHDVPWEEPALVREILRRARVPSALQRHIPTYPKTA
jgi:formate-dependent phosphoribosylglycinamide formyltransferase (GAR transformylase)